MLLFMNLHARLIINKKCQKGSGHHMDILLLCILNVGCAIIGAPWQPAATVRAVSHVSALTVYSQNQAPGEKPKVAEIKGRGPFLLSMNLLIPSIFCHNALWTVCCMHEVRGTYGQIAILTWELLSSLHYKALQVLG